MLGWTAGRRTRRIVLTMLDYGATPGDPFGECLAGGFDDAHADALLERRCVVETWLSEGGCQPVHTAGDSAAVDWLLEHECSDCVRDLAGAAHRRDQQARQACIERRGAGCVADDRRPEPVPAHRGKVPIHPDALQAAIHAALAPLAS